ncbi:MAG: glycosyltransferase family 2 protein [Erysipelotrichaceae bacterium]|jgi:glycosyltransferase involved in cell wall biosynthesis|nr:glycosyltransferase family 2 protein [Erysipelotrichaceae bacterium]
MNKEVLSIVIPAYNEEGNIERTTRVLSGLMESEKINYAIYYVDDGSKDKTWEQIEAIARENKRVKGIHFSRNFGKEAAMFAGLEMVAGDCAVVMDCDLQHPAETVIKMYHMWELGFEVVEGVKLDRGKESALHKFAVKVFYKLMSDSTKIDMSKASDFKLMDRKVIDALVSLPERNTFFRALSSWVGFKTTTVGFYVAEREIGTSKWNLGSLIRYAINNITSFTTKPLHLVFFMGGLYLILALIQGIECLVTYISHNAVEGFTTVILIQLITGSIVMLSLGIIGTYIAKIYEEVKNRHRYIVSKTVNIASKRNDK